MMDPTKKAGKSGTKTLEPPAKKSSEQVPAGDDSDINVGNEGEQRTNVDEYSTPKKENRPIEKDKESRSDENSGCAC